MSTRDPSYAFTTPIEEIIKLRAIRHVPCEWLRKKLAEWVFRSTWLVDWECVAFDGLWVQMRSHQKNEDYVSVLQNCEWHVWTAPQTEIKCQVICDRCSKTGVGVINKDVDYVKAEGFRRVKLHNYITNETIEEDYCDECFEEWVGGDDGNHDNQASL